MLSLYDNDNNKIIINTLITKLFYLGNEEIILILLNAKCYELTFRVFENERFGNLDKYKEYYMPFYILFNDNNTKIQIPQELLYINSRLKYINEVRFTVDKYDELQKVLYSLINNNNHNIIKCLLNNNNEILLQIISIIYSHIKNDLDILKKIAIIKLLLHLFNCYPNYLLFKKNPVSNITPVFTDINFISELNKCEFIPVICFNIIQISNSLITFSNKNYLSYIFSHLNEDIPTSSFHNINVTVSSLNEYLIYTLSLFISFIRLNPKPLSNNATFPNAIDCICKLLLLISPSQICFNEIYQSIYSLIEIFSYERSLFANTFFNKILIIYVKYLTIPKNNEFTSIINQTLIKIIELFTHYIELNKGTSQYWLKINQVIPLITKCIKLNNNKHVILTSLHFIHTISTFADKIFLDYLINDDLVHVMTYLFEKNYNQQNIIFSTICSFFEGIKREKIILQKMLCLKIGFFSNDKYTKFFSNLLQYANINTNINEITSKTGINNNNQFLSKKHDRLMNDDGKLY